MTDARTKIDILYKDVLGEVTDVIERVERLKIELPATAEETLSRPVGQLIMAAQHFEKKVIELTQKRVDAAKAEIAASGERAKNDALGDIRQAIREAVAQPAVDLVKDLTIAVNKAQGQQAATFKRVIVAAVVSGLVSGAVSFGCAFFLFKPQAPAASEQVEDAAPAAAKPMKKGSK